MPYNSQVTSPTNDVRLLTNDVDLTPVFGDAEIGRFLALEGGDIYRAAAAALLTIAGNETLRTKYIESRGITLDGTKVGAELRQQAKQLREQAADRPAAEDVDDESFRVVEQPCPPLPVRLCL